MIDFLQLYLIEGKERWIADGIEVNRKYLCGKRVLRFEVYQEIIE